MFSLPDLTQCTLKKVNVRHKKEGDAIVTVHDLILVMRQRCALMNDMSDGIAEAFFQADDKGELTIMRHRKVASLKWLTEYTGRRAIIDYGLGENGERALEFGSDSSNIDLYGVRISKITDTLCDDGIVSRQFNLSASKLSVRDAGTIDTLAGKTIWIQLPVTLEEILAEEEREAAEDGDGESEGEDGEGNGDGSGELFEEDNDGPTEAFIEAHGTPEA